MSKSIIPAIGVVGSILMLPTAGLGEQSLWCPPFPLPTSVRVGQSWTYSVEKVKYGRDEDGIAYRDSQDVGTQTLKVVRSHQIGDRTYLELDDGGLYRVDEAGRTWQYDVRNASEELLWDIWGPPVDDALLAREPRARYVIYEQANVSEISVGGVLLGGELSVEWEGFRLSRGGPFARHEWDAIPHLNRIRQRGLWQESVLDEIVELYVFDFNAFEGGSYCVFAPGLGVLYSGYWIGWEHAGGEMRYYLKSTEEVATVAKEKSFGEIKEWVTRSSSN